MKDILRVKNLNKSYKNFSLTDVSFSLSEGCITGFIGINGAGKTTTLRTILDLAKKDSGNIQFFGLDMDKMNNRLKIASASYWMTAVFMKKSFGLHKKLPDSIYHIHSVHFFELQC